MALPMPKFDRWDAKPLVLAGNFACTLRAEEANAYAEHIRKFPQLAEWQITQVKVCQLEATKLGEVEDAEAEEILEKWRATTKAIYEISKDWYETLMREIEEKQNASRETEMST